MSSSRHLTDAEKAQILSEWSRLQRTLRPIDRDVPGCRGYPDRDILPLCDALNAIDGVCTVQSCAGHGSPEDVQATGQVWVRLSLAMSRAFDVLAIDLARQPLIEGVARRYQPYGQEIVDVQFQGNERGKLAESIRLVIDFFESLRR